MKNIGTIIGLLLLSVIGYWLFGQFTDYQNVGQEYDNFLEYLLHPNT